MENKINIAEILKDCPKGTKLYSPICGECEFSKISDRDGNLFIEVKANDECFLLNECGYYWYTTHGECLLYPSKDQRDWTKFQRPIKPKFKVGDIIRYRYYDREPLRVKKNQQNGYLLSNGDTLMFQDESAWEIPTDKFDIATLKPFESKVLVRSDNHNLWKPAIFGMKAEYRTNAHYVLGGNCWTQCIPYEGNEHLLGTANDCNNYYKTWE